MRIRTEFMLTTDTDLVISVCQNAQAVGGEVYVENHAGVYGIELTFYESQTDVSRN